MADYKELLRKAIAALPENNGSSRRAVYEKARSALVGQLRAITPPLAARDITTHRLQLEDGIRQVEQEASEAVIAKLDKGDADELEIKPAASRPLVNGAANASPAAAPRQGSIEDIIAAADRTPAARPKVAPPVEPDVGEPAKSEAAPRPAPSKPVVVAKAGAKEPVKDTPKEPSPDLAKETAKSDDKVAAAKAGSRPLPSIVARAEAAKARGNTTAFGVPADKPAVDSARNDSGRRSPSFEPRRESAAGATRIEHSAGRGQAATARQPVPEAIPFAPPAISAAMSSVREVEVEPVLTADPQGAIDRAIATLDREARGESDAAVNGADHVPLKGEPSLDIRPVKSFPDPVRPKKRERNERAERPDRKDRGDRSPFVNDGTFQRTPQPDADRGGISALTIFLFVFVILLAGVGGAGFWAWREGYIDLDALFTGSAPSVVATDAPAATPTPLTTTPTDTAAITGPGNTAATAADALAIGDDGTIPTTDSALVVDERLAATPAVEAPEIVEPLALAPSSDEAKTEERLPVEEASPQTASEAIAAVNPANVAGSQSLLLEAADDGSVSAIPFSGTVEWSKGVDELGLPTLVGKANIPARNMDLELLIRKNSDPTLPASHLMEINFTVSETFIGGSVAGLPGILLKNEELAQGSPLVGASARVLGNSFLFALSASPEDAANNSALITGRKWMDIAIIYATGKRAIITLEKDPAAETMFNEVFSAWGGPTTAAASAT